MLDFPASGQALWALFDAGGPRPEYVLPTLYYESSGFNPAISNAAGYPYYGLNQISGSRLQAMGINPTDYLTWPASKQISQVVKPYILGIVEQYGPIQSATRMEQANFLPATLATAKNLGSVLAQEGQSAYTANASTFDPNRSGVITVGSLAVAMNKAASSQAVQNAISNTYALRPGESPHDPVYGEDFSPWHGAAVAAVIVVAGLGLASLVREGVVDDALRWVKERADV